MYQTTSIHSGDDQFIAQWNLTHLPTGGRIFMSFGYFSLSQAITLQINQRLSPPPIPISQRHFASQAGCSATDAEGVRTLVCCSSCNINQAGWEGLFGAWFGNWSEWVLVHLCVSHTQTPYASIPMCVCVFVYTMHLSNPFLNLVYCPIQTLNCPSCATSTIGQPIVYSLHYMHDAYALCPQLHWKFAGFWVFFFSLWYLFSALPELCVSLAD